MSKTPRTPYFAYEPNEKLLLKMLGVIRVDPVLVVGDEGFNLTGVTVRVMPDELRLDDQVGALKTWASERFSLDFVNIDIEEI